MANARLEELKARFEENPRRYFAPFANELRKTGDHAQAIAICRTHLATQPGHVSGHIVLAQALQEVGELDESRTQFEAALELDPENLIALRHMGDISRTRGDLDSARGWYQRVLDADPRNDDMARMLRELVTAPNEAAPAAPPAVPEAPAAPATPRPPELSYGPPDSTTFAPPLLRAEAPRDDAAVEASGGPARSDATPVDSVTDEAREPAPKSQAPEQPKAAAADTEDSLDTWYLPGTTRQLDEASKASERSANPELPAETEWHDDAFELTGELSTPIDDWMPRPTPAAELSDHEAAPELWIDEVGSDEGAPRNDDATPASASRGYEDELESWFEAGATPERAEASPAASEPGTPPAEAAHAPGDEPSWMSRPDAAEEEPTRDGAVRPSHEEPVGRSQPSLPEPANGHGNTDATTPAQVDAMLGRTPDFHDTAPETPVAPFVTETLAELYLQQGFREEALAIYRELVERDPGDEALRRRVEAIEAGESSDVVPGFTAHPPAAPDRSSVSVRTFFGRLARRTVGNPPRGGHEGGGQSRPPESLLTRPRTGSFPAMMDRAPVELTPDPEQSVHEVQPSKLSTLFGTPRPSEADTQAANALASAFTESPAPDGRPSRVAERELSLDHLFRDGSDASARRTSMDDFYRPPSPGGAVGAGESGKRVPEERTADLRQFTAWLEGLKKK